MTPSPPRTPRGIEPRWRARRQAWGYRVRYTDPTTSARRVKEFDTLADAEDFQAYLRLARRSGALAELDRGRTPLTVFCEQEWWAHYAPTRLEVNTRKSYASLWNNHLYPRVGHLELRQLTAPIVNDLRQSMEAAGVQPPTVRKALAVLQSICAYAVTRGEIASNPVAQVRKPPARRVKIIDPISVAEVEALIGALRDRASNPGEWMLAELIAYSGARPEDALALPFSRVGRQRLVYAAKNVDGRILEGSKTGTEKARSVELLDHLRRDLRDYQLATGRRDDQGLVIVRTDSAPWRLHDYKNWQRRELAAREPGGRPRRRAGLFAAAASAIGRPAVTPYFLRHTYASLRIAEQRLSLLEIASEMGHSVEVLASTYAHVISEYAGQGPIDPDAEIARARGGESARAV